MRPAGNREPRLGADGVRRDRDGGVGRAVHAGRLDPLERRLAARERDDLALGAVHVGEALALAPALERVEIEAENVGFAARLG